MGTSLECSGSLLKRERINRKGFKTFQDLNNKQKNVVFGLESSFTL